MSIGQYTITANQSATDIVTQGKFIFYKRSGGGVTNTDVGVTVDGHYIGVMNPSEAVKLNTEFSKIVLTPADTSNTGLFIVAGSDEEYRTAQVSGLVQVSNFPTAFNITSILSETSTDIVNAGNAYTAQVNTTFAAATTNFTAYFYNRTSSPSDIFLTSILIQLSDDITCAPLNAKMLAAFFTHTDNTMGTSSFNHGTFALNSNFGTSLTSPSGQTTNSASYMFLTNYSLMRLDRPYKISAGRGAYVDFILPAGSNQRNLRCNFNFNV